MNHRIRMLRLRRASTVLLLGGLAVPGPLRAQGEGHPAPSVLETKQEAASMVDRIGASVDPELTFTDERGYPYKLRQLFPGQRPVVLLLGYYSCPAMCGQVMAAAFAALNEVDLAPATDYQILSVSIDPRETPELARTRKESFLPRLAKVGAGDGWHVCVGEDEAVRSLADQVGFRYFWSEHTNQYAHPPAVVFLSPAGKVSRVIVNTVFDPADMRLALVEASEGKLGSLWDQVRLNCLTFDSRTNSYSLAAMTIMRIGGAITVVVLAVTIFTMLRRERRRAQPDGATATSPGGHVALPRA